MLPNSWTAMIIPVVNVHARLGSTRDALVGSNSEVEAENSHTHTKKNPTHILELHFHKLLFAFYFRLFCILFHSRLCILLFLNLL